MFAGLSLDEIGSFHERLGILAWIERWYLLAVIQLGGATACLAGVLTYVRRVGGDEVQKFRVGRRGRIAVGVAGLLLTLFVVARRSAQRALTGRRGHRRRWTMTGGVALVLSAYFDAGLYGYTPWLAAIGWPHVAVLATAASAFWLWKTV